MNVERSFERFVADNVAGNPGGDPMPEDFYDDIHAFASRTRQRPEWLALIKEPPMRISNSVAVGSAMARVAVLAITTLLLVLTVAGAGIAGSRLLTAVQDEGAAFPIGTFVAAEWGDYFVEFNDDGTCRWASHRYGESWDCTYDVDGYLYTESTNNSGDKGYVAVGPVPPPPVTFRWAYDGELLDFELVGEDPNSWRRAFYEDQAYRFVPEPREVVLAGYDIAAGTELLPAHTELRLVPGAEVPDDALSDRDLATGRIAAVPITEGKAITPGLLTSPE